MLNVKVTVNVKENVKVKIIVNDKCQGEGHCQQ